MKAITEYGFTKEEAGDIAFALALYDQWKTEFKDGSYFDDRYKALIKDFAGSNPLTQTLVAGFLGGLGKGLEAAMKAEQEAN